ncbi:MAG: CDP-diacylglycerol diphosphatase [Janthinobacterium lividum]
MVLLPAMVAGCTGTPIALLLPPPVHANGQVLWHIVNERCVPGQRVRNNPAPCAEVSITQGRSGHVVLKDIEGKSQYLVLPTSKITGIEDPQLLAPDAPNYFTPAWGARKLVANRLGKPLARADVGIAVNSLYGRTQDQLHLHVDCLRSDVRVALRQAAPKVGYHWAHQTLMLGGFRYRAVRIDGDEAVAIDPFHLMARGLRVRQEDMGAWTLLLAGMDYPDGRPGFMLLAARADPATGFNASSGDLEDHACGGVGVAEHR